MEVASLFSTTSSIHWANFLSSLSAKQLLDRFSIHRGDFCHRQILNSTSIVSFPSRFSAQQISIDTSIHRAVFYIYSWGAISDSLFSFSLNRFHFSFTPNTLLPLKSLYPRDFWPRSSLNHLVSVLNPSFYMHSCIFYLGFGVFENFCGF